MSKVWVLETHTKGTGANMVPLEKVLSTPEPAARRPHRRTRTSETAEGRRPARSSKRKDQAPRTSTALPPGHVRRKGTGEIGRIQSVDAQAGTAHVTWLKRGSSSTVPLTAISRR
jgi:hypothetical protein